MLPGNAGRSCRGKNSNMKLGIFDSGLGGLLIAKSIHDAMPALDMVYFGDTLHLPYGNRSCDVIHDYCVGAMDFLFKQDCNLIVMACNTASAKTLRTLQQGYLLPKRPDKNIIGVIVPTLERAIDIGSKNIGVLATTHLVLSNVYKDELNKLAPDINIFQQEAPLLVPLIEHDGKMEWIMPILQSYLRPLLEENIETLILGCTHYAYLKDAIQNIVGSDITILSQNDVIPQKLEEYLNNHPEYSQKISRNGDISFFMSDITDSYTKSAQEIFNANIAIEKADFYAQP